MNGNIKTTRHAQMIAAGRGIRPTHDVIEMCYELLEARYDKHGVLGSIRLILASVQHAKYNPENHDVSLVDKFHIENVSFAYFNYELDVLNVNFKEQVA